MKIIKPTPHAVIDYAFAGKMIAAPWVLGFSRNKTATANAVGTGATILGLSLMTRYPLGVFKLIPFPVHGIIEAVAGVATAAAPWLMGFSDNRRAKWLHVGAGLSTLAVVALTDYQAAGQPRRARQVVIEERSRPPIEAQSEQAVPPRPSLANPRIGADEQVPLRSGSYNNLTDAEEIKWQH